MSLFLEISPAEEKINPTNNPDLSSLIPLNSMNYGIEKNVQHKGYETEVSHSYAHDLVITKSECDKTPDIMMHTHQRKTKHVRIYRTESIGNSPLGNAVSALKIKTVYDFGNAHIRSLHGSVSGISGGEALEIIHISYSQLSIRRISELGGSSQGFDLKKGKPLD